MKLLYNLTLGQSNTVSLMISKWKLLSKNIASTFPVLQNINYRSYSGASAEQDKVNFKKYRV